MGRIDIGRLDLCGRARLAAQALARAHPDVMFTSGRRTLEEQATAMARNVVDERGWIAATYKASLVSQRLQAWVDSHPESDSVAELAAGLLATMRQFSEHELIALSKHLTGEAFDVLPIAGRHGQLVVQSLRRIVAEFGGKLLEREGGKIVWHAQF